MLLEHERNNGLGMDALVTVCSWNTSRIMVWAWMLWSPELWFGHGCSGHRMLLEHERNYGLGMDALVIDCSWNTNGIMDSLVSVGSIQFGSNWCQNCGFGRTHTTKIQNPQDAAATK